MTQSYRTRIRDALAYTVATLRVVPVATVNTGGVLAGATSVTVTLDPSITTPIDQIFFPGAWVTWHDSTGEFPCVIADNGVVPGTPNTTGTITFVRCQGKTGAGLQYGHSAGALLATNLIPVRPPRQNDGLTLIMIGNGYPVIRVYSFASTINRAGLAQQQPIIAAHVVYQLPLNQPGQAGDPNWVGSDEWALLLDNRAESDMGAIINQLHSRAGSQLVVAGQGPQADIIEQMIHASVDNQDAASNGLALYQSYLDLRVSDFIKGIDEAF